MQTPLLRLLPKIIFGGHTGARGKTKTRKPLYFKGLRVFGNYSNSIVPGGLPVQS